MDLVDEEHVAVVELREDGRQVAGPLQRGPDVTCRWASSSLAMIVARVVLPSPGGPENSRWSEPWPRRRAASSTMSRWALSSAWPTNSASRRGRSPASAAPPRVWDSGSNSSLDAADP